MIWCVFGLGWWGIGDLLFVFILCGIVSGVFGSVFELGVGK